MPLYIDEASLLIRMAQLCLQRGVGMKGLAWLGALALTGTPIWAAQKMTVDQLKTLLATDKEAQKPDADYGPEKVGDKTLVVPVQTLIDTLEQPYPDSSTGRFIIRHTLFAVDYKEYKAGS